MAINYEQLQSTMSDQSRRWTYAKNQAESPYLRKRSQELENYRLKAHKKSVKKGSGPPVADAPTTSGKPVQGGGIGKQPKPGARKPGSGQSTSSDSVDLSGFDKIKGPSTKFENAPMKRMGPSGSPFHGSPPSPTNFRDQGTAGAKVFSVQRPRSPFARPGEVTNPKGKSSWRDRNVAAVSEARAEVASKRFSAGAPPLASEAMSAARGVTHSTGESWSARTGKTLLKKSAQIGQQRAAMKSSAPATPKPKPPVKPSGNPGMDRLSAALGGTTVGKSGTGRGKRAF